jgi:methyl-accepting chemotaxis protein
VQQAGSAMQEIVSGVQRVSDIIGEISAAAREQSEGIGSVNATVSQLDQATQQNAALVEESAAAAESLKDQARRLGETIAIFKVGNERRPEPVAKPPPSASPSTPALKPAPGKPKLAPKGSGAAAKPAAASPAAPRPAPPAPAPAADGDWETF